MTTAGVAGRTFTSKAPFCESGSAVDVPPEELRRPSLRLCGRQRQHHARPRLQRSGRSGDGDWSILEGTGQYAAFAAGARFGARFYGTRFSYVPQHVPGVRGRRRRGADDRPREREGVEGQGHEGRLHDSGRARHPRRRRGQPGGLQVIVMRESGTGPWLASKSGEAIGASPSSFASPPNGPVRAVLIRTTAVSGRDESCSTPL